jgi:hypothetical protein
VFDYINIPPNYLEVEFNQVVSSILTTHLLLCELYAKDD